uniref:DOMON domain-containing protein n=1 Tax=Heterorhabditis bacteriophora TaxID=37862 RepID=A0A1I7XSR2_HETBA
MRKNRRRSLAVFWLVSDTSQHFFFYAFEFANFFVLLKPFRKPSTGSGWNRRELLPREYTLFKYCQVGYGISKNHKSGEHLRYRVSWSVVDTEYSDSASPRFHAYHIDWIIGGLIPDSEYNCTLKPFDRRGNYGGESTGVRILTKQRPPSMSPKIKKLSLKPLVNFEYFESLCSLKFLFSILAIMCCIPLLLYRTMKVDILQYLSGVLFRLVLKIIPMIQLVTSSPRVIRLGSQSTMESTANSKRGILIPLVVISALLSF